MRHILLPFLVFVHLTALLYAERSGQETIVRFFDTHEKNGKVCEEYHYLSDEQRFGLLKNNFYLGDILRDSFRLNSIDPDYLVDTDIGHCDSIDAETNALKYTEKVQYLNDDIVTIETEQYIYGVGSTHGLLDSAYHIYDREYGMEIVWEALFGKSKVFDLYVLNRVIDELANEAYIDYFKNSEALLNFRVPGYFSINDKGLFIQYGEYEIAPYASGRPSLTVPKEVLKKYMSKEMYHKCFVKKKFMVDAHSAG